MTRKTLLFAEIKESIEQQIISGKYKPHSKLPGNRQLMSLYGVSQSTISKAIGELINNGLIYIEKGKGVFVGEKINKRSDINTIGTIIPTFTISHYSQMLKGVEEAIISEEKEMFVISMENVHNKHISLSQIADHLCGLIIAVGITESELEKLTRVNSDIAVVLVDFSLETMEEITYIRCDDYNGALMATEYLINLGHRKILHLTGPEGGVSGRERLRGYKETMEKHNLEPIYRYTGWLFEEGFKVFNETYEKFKPTAVFASNDLVALGAMKAAFIMGKQIPEEISFIGFGGLIEGSYSLMRLTTVSQAPYQMGRMAANCLLNKLQGKKVESQVLPVELIIGDSTARIK